MLASAAILAGAVCTPVLAQRQDDALVHDVPRRLNAAPVEVASASLRLSGAGHAVESIPLPRPLDPVDAARIARIFALQGAGDLEQAARETARLHDRVLVQDILADRMLRSGSQVRVADVTQWLRRWPDHPDAPRLKRLLVVQLHQRPANDNSPGQVVPTPTSTLPYPLAEEADPAAFILRRNRLLDRTVRERLQQGPTGARSALRLVRQTNFPDPLYAAMLRAEIARTQFAQGETGDALRTAMAASAWSGGRIGLAGFVAGLAAWRTGDRAGATRRFEQASRAKLTAPGITAGAAFWAARGHAAAGDAAEARGWLREAAAYNHTFYGLLASHLLETPDADPAAAAPRVLGEADVEAVAAMPAGRSAFALLQVGQPARAEATLRAMRGNAPLRGAVARVAYAAGLTALATQIETTLPAPGGAGGADVERIHSRLPRLQPRHGFTVDPALVYALARVESNFDNRAVSGAGAHGLMQVMPVTARFMQDQGSPARHRGGNLANPAVNLELGQDYVIYLAGQDGVRSDLIRLLASYNAGPNALASWHMDSEGGDPLLFIESLPNTETRDFVHRTLAWLWVYAARMQRPSPSLDTLAQGGWPRFDEEQHTPRLTPVALPH